MNSAPPGLGAVRRRWIRYTAIAAVLALLTVELVLGWPSLTDALRHLHRPHPGWLALATAAEILSMNAYARMQRRLLQSAGVRAPYLDNTRLAYAAHSLNETLPGGPAFSTQLNYQQMRRFGATPAVASWVIALSGILSAAALAAITAAAAIAAGGDTDWPHLAGLLLAATLLILGVRHAARRPDTIAKLAGAPLTAVNRLRRRPADHGHERIHGFLGQLRTARLRPVLGLAATVLALANWLLDAIGLWLCFRAVGAPTPGLTPTLLAFCAAMAAGTITIVPGGFGVIDSALVLGLIAGGVTTPAAVTAVVLYRVISFGFIIGVGWLSWLRLRRSTPAAGGATMSRARCVPARRVRSTALSHRATRP
ncbi:lysylphosphatidylglycerol synthase transmembrane domain-containing protein [Actinoplanes regularis]|uniref:lysylphosphatidylglycerol synthase transmembrane domain-containing protein n=1 Tax=Actinoplanes regularis TaxID=52697 RepID=UPI0024A1D85A|nr:YbhN family protein [Actinoplanes regularis]GLW31771.1 membrane protein [Actinoplanes regularis]